MKIARFAVFLVTLMFGPLAAALLAAYPVTSGIVAEELRQGRHILKAQAFYLVNDQDRIRASLALSQDRPTLTLFDERGQARGQVLMMATDQAGITLSDAKGVPRLHLVILPDGSPTVILSDEQRQPRAAIALSPEGRPSLSFMDEKGQLQAQLWTKPDDTVSLDIEKLKAPQD